MTDSVAQDQIRAFVDRILRLKGEAKDINRDIREVYGEAKGNGFDKTVLGKLVSYVEKRENGATDLQEAEALFDLYLSAYDGVGTSVATHTHETKSTAARKDVPLKAGLDGRNTSQRETERSGGRAPSGTEAGSPSANQVQAAGTQAPPVDTHPVSSAVLPRQTEDRSVAAALHGSAPVTHSEPVTDPPPAMVTVVAGREGATDPSALPAVRLDHSKPHPDCQDPEDCGLASWTHMCGGCMRARAATAAGVALQ